MPLNSYVVRTVQWRGPSPSLPALDIELTERCQNNCIHCCINLPFDDPAAQQELSTAYLRDILKEAVDLGCLQIRFTGGEVLLRDDFEDLYIFTRRLGMKVMLFTNARLITPSLADLFAKIPPLLPIEISVYGMTADSYDVVTRAPGAFSEYRRGLDLLLARRVSLFLKWVPLPPNRDELPEFEDWASTLPLTAYSSGADMFFQLRIRRDDPVKDRVITNLRPSPSKMRVSEGMDRFCRNFLGPHGGKLFSCGIGERPCINAYGQIQPCLTMRAPELSYDLLAGSLQEAVEWFRALKQLRATLPKYLGRCAKCFLRSLCDQCPALSWAENGNFETPIEYLCKGAHAQARALGLIEEGEQGWQIEDWKIRVDRLKLV